MRCVFFTVYCSPEAEKLNLVERLQKLLTTKGNSESEVMEILGDPALIQQLMVLTDKQVDTVPATVPKYSSEIYNYLLALSELLFKV